MKEQEYSMWKHELYHLRKTLAKCLKEIEDLPITFQKPLFYEQKIQRLKQGLSQEDSSFVLESYIQIFAYLIQERHNVSLQQLSKQFSEYFGGPPLYWAQKINLWAFMTTFTSDFTIWSVLDSDNINYTIDPQNRSRISKFRKKAAQYTFYLQKLIKRIDKLTKDDDKYCLDDLYVRYHEQKTKYYIFVKKFKMFALTDQQVSMTMKSKITAQKKMFRFPEQTHTIQDFNDKKTSTPRTLDMFNFRLQKEGCNQGQVFKQQMRKCQMQKTKQILAKIGRNEGYQIQFLKKEFLQKNKKAAAESTANSKLQAQVQVQVVSHKKQELCDQQTQQISCGDGNSSSKDLQKENTLPKPVHHFSCVHLYSSYFAYDKFPITEYECRKLIKGFSYPFEKVETLSYDLDSEEQYQEIKEGFDLLSSMNSKMSDESLDEQFIRNFIDNSQCIYNSDGEAIELQPKKQELQGQLITWQASRGDPILQNCCILHCQSLAFANRLKIKRTHKKYLRDRKRNISNHEKVYENEQISYESQRQQSGSFRQNQKTKSEKSQTSATDFIQPAEQKRQYFQVQEQNLLGSNKVSNHLESLQSNELQIAFEQDTKDVEI